MSSYPWMKFPFTKEVPVIQKQVRCSAHALLYCKTEKILFGYLPMQYAIMMQLRFDGTLGFPGGYFNVDETPAAGLNRELKEEVGLKEKYFFTMNEYHGAWTYYSNSTEQTPLVDHFFVKEYSEKTFKKIESSAQTCEDWGTETLGLIRVPLQNVDALGNFFAHNFVGNARDQLVKILLERELVQESDVNEAWTIAQKKAKSLAQ